MSVSKKFHFFKLNSRLGLLNAPHRQKEPNFGVEKAPSAILSESFLRELDTNDYCITEFTFAPPDNFTLNSQNAILAKYLKGAADLINRKAGPDEIIICLGGDHSITFSSLLAHLNRSKNPKELGYIQIDSHGDSNLFSTSPTGNFHGMFLRPFFADFDSAEISQLIPHQLSHEQILFIGNLDLDLEEVRLFKEKNIKVIDGVTLGVLPQQALQTITAFMNRFEHLHVSLDVDAFDKSIAPATGIPAHNGLHKEDLYPVIKLLFTHKNVTLDLVEVNPLKPGSKQTIQLAQEILKLFI